VCAQTLFIYVCDYKRIPLNDKILGYVCEYTYIKRKDSPRELNLVGRDNA